MYALVKFYDDIYDVCKSSTIIVRNGITKAMYKDKRRYPVKDFAKNSNKLILQEILKNINKGKPYIICKKIRFVNKNVHLKETAAKKKDCTSSGNYDASLNIKKKVRFADKNIRNKETVGKGKNCTSLENCDAQIALDHKKRCIDENMYNEETATQKLDCITSENCVSQISLDVNTKIISTDKNIYNEETVAQDCMSIKNCDSQVPLLDINAMITSADKNIYNEKTVAQDCTSVKNCDSQVPLLDINAMITSADENIYNKESVAQDCTPIKNCDAQVPFLDINNAMITFADENMPNEKTVAQGKEYTTLGNCNAQLPLDIDTLINVIDKDGNFIEADMQGYKSLDNSDILLTLDMHYDVTSTNLDQCIKQLTFSDCENSINANTPTTSNKGNIPVLSPVLSSLVFESHDINENKETSESEYLPSEDELRSLAREEQQENNKKLLLNKTVSSISSIDVSTDNIGTACNDENMYVEKSNAKSIKRNYCFFCSKLQTQLPRHLKTAHRNEPEVKKFAMLSRGNPERRKIIDIIRKNGNFKFNIDSDVNDGKLLVCRRPNEKYSKSATDFIACGKCKGFFSKKSIRNHSRNCFKKDFSKNKCIMIMGRKVTCRLHHLASDTLKKIVFPIMREDEVTRIIRYDELLIVYANKLCVKYTAQHQHDMIRARLRVLGRFLIALKKINTTVEDFKSLYHPKVYDDCIAAINVVAGYNDEENTYKAPAVAANLSTLLKHVGNLLITEYIKKDDSEKKN